MERINILYCFDAKYWMMAAVSMESLLASANKKICMTIYCMVAPNTPGYRKIKKMIKSHKLNVNLVWREIKPRENPFQNYVCSRWSPVIYYHCFAHRIFKDVDKMLYLDSDTLIYKDVSELYNTDVSDCVFAAVPDMAQTHNKNDFGGMFVKNFSKKYLNNGIYYNTGVMVLNLKKMAEYEHLLFETDIPLKYPDQDLMNVAFIGKIKTLPLKYNLVPGMTVTPVFNPAEIQEAMTGGQVVVHCYTAKPYDFAHASKQVYAVFAKHAENLDKMPKDFVKHDQDYAKNLVRETFVPHITVRRGRIYFFGIKI